MIVKMKPRGQEYPKIFNTRETGKMSKTQFISEGDIVSFTSKGNKCNFIYTEIRATVQAPLRETVNVGLQILQTSQFLMQQKTLKS
jgi:hypothetical protein